MSHKIDREWHKKRITKYSTSLGSGVWKHRGGGWVYFAEGPYKFGHQHMGAGSTPQEAVRELRASRGLWRTFGAELTSGPERGTVKSWISATKNSPTS